MSTIESRIGTRFPSFVIVGAMKAGTTSLRDCLVEIPHLFIPESELYFFSDDEKYARGMDWYARFFESSSDQDVVGEKTATYSYAPAVPERMRACLPQVKLIWIFREPVSRTYSHYWHSVRNGSERLNFETAIEREQERVRKDIFRGYARRSCYADQVERYLEFFTRDQMLFLLFEEFVQDPAPVINRTLEFIGLPTRIENPDRAKHSHKTYAPRVIWLQWLARQMLGKGRPFRLVRRLNRRQQPGYPKMSERMRTRLRDSFRAPNERLAAITGLDLTLWAK